MSELRILRTSSYKLGRRDLASSLYLDGRRASPITEILFTITQTRSLGNLHVGIYVVQSMFRAFISGPGENFPYKQDTKFGLLIGPAPVTRPIFKEALDLTERQQQYSHESSYLQQRVTQWPGSKSNLKMK